MDIHYDKLCYGCFEEKDAALTLCPRCGFDASAEPMYPLALPLGSILNGRYLVGKPLGQGGFGITYLAFDMTLQIKVAIKEFLPTGMISRDADHSTVILLSRRNDEAFRTNKEKFLDEARILARLSDSQNIVKVQNYFTENNTAYFSMEYVDGISLKDLVAQQGGRLPWELVNGYLLPVARALVQVHAQRLLHRDISPDNIYITQRGVSKLLDFGAARAAGGDSRSMSIILKHGFAPEEQYRTRGNQGPWTDVYALAATYYYCLTGSLTPDSIDRLHADTLVEPSHLGVKLPPIAEAALLKALAVNAEDRFSNMQAFMDAVTGKTPVEMPKAATPPVFLGEKSGLGTTGGVPATGAAGVAGAASTQGAPAAPAYGSQAYNVPAPASASAHLSPSYGTSTPAPSQPYGAPSAGGQPTAQTFGGQPTGGQPTGVQPTGAQPTGAQTYTPVFTPPPKPKSKRLPLIIGGAAAAVVILVVVIVLAVVNPFAPPPPVVEEPPIDIDAVVVENDNIESGTETPGGPGSGIVPQPATDGYYTSTECPVSIIPSSGWIIDDSKGSLLLTSPRRTAIISFFYVDSMTPTNFASQSTAMMQTAMESFSASSYTFISEENRTIGDHEFYILAFSLEMYDGTYQASYYVTSDDARGGIISMWLEMPDASEGDHNDMLDMIGSLKISS